MQRIIVGMAISAIAVLLPNPTFAAGSGKAQQIVKALRDSGRLKDYDITVKYEGGVARLQGRVASENQRLEALEVAKTHPGVHQVVDEMTIGSTASRTNANFAASRSTDRRITPVKYEDTGSLTFPELPGEKNPTESARKKNASFQTTATSRQAARTPVLSSTVSTPRPIVKTPTLIRPLPVTEEKSEPVATIVNQPVPAAQNPMRAAPVAAARQSNINAAAEQQAEQQVVPQTRDDQAIAQDVAKNLKALKLKGYHINLNVTNGVVVLNGHVSTEQQLEMVQAGVVRVPGIRGLENHLNVHSPAVPAVMQANYRGQEETLGDEAAAVQQQQQPQQTPKQFALPKLASPLAMLSRKNRSQAGNAPLPQGGSPVPIHAAGQGGVAPAHYDQAHMPNHAWPSYAAYPNYGAVTYPRQYSPSAWPYIGPFYPYPQVPLGWRKVTLQWDDGWWYLDFCDR